MYVDNAVPFLERWKDNPAGKPFIENGHWMVLCSPQFSNAKDMIVSEAYHSGVGKELSVDEMTVRGEDDVITYVQESILVQLFEPLMPWEC